MSTPQRLDYLTVLSVHHVCQQKRSQSRNGLSRKQNHVWVYSELALIAKEPFFFCYITQPLNNFSFNEKSGEGRK